MKNLTENTKPSSNDSDSKGDVKASPVIKKENSPPEYITADELNFRIKEIAKCKADPVYFSKYFTIINLDTGLTRLKLYDKQKDFLRFLATEKRVVAKSARQSGKSLCYSVLVLWMTIFFPEKKVLILANKASTAIEILSKIQLAYDYLDPWIKPAVVTYNKQSLIFSNKSEIRVFSSSSDGARGFTANCVTGNTVVQARFKFFCFPKITVSIPIWGIYLIYLPGYIFKKIKNKIVSFFNSK